jgi:DNA-binding FadR family transcriptional regulator
VYVQDRQNAKPSPGEMTPATGTADRPDTTPDTTPEATPEWGPLELIRARRVVEGEIAALAASQAKRADIARMTAAIKAMQRDADAGTLPLDGDRDFHTAVVNACGNAVLTETVQNFWDSRRGPLFTRLGDYFENAESWRAAIAEHQAVLNAIRARDAPAARAAMQLHMDNSHARFSVSWRQVKAA